MPGQQWCLAQIVFKAIFRPARWKPSSAWVMHEFQPTGRCTVQSVTVTHSMAQLKWPQLGGLTLETVGPLHGRREGGGVALCTAAYDRLIDQTKAPCKYSSYLQATTGNKGALLCVNSRQANLVAGRILQPHPHYASVNGGRNLLRGLTVSSGGI